MKDSSTDRLFTSISEQVYELKLRRKKPSLILMSQRTRYDINRKQRD